MVAYGNESFETFCAARMGSHIGTRIFQNICDNFSKVAPLNKTRSKILNGNERHVQLNALTLVASRLFRAFGETATWSFTVVLFHDSEQTRKGSEGP